MPPVHYPISPTSVGCLAFWLINAEARKTRRTQRVIRVIGNVSSNQTLSCASSLEYCGNLPPASSAPPRYITKRFGLRRTYEPGARMFAKRAAKSLSLAPRCSRRSLCLFSVRPVSRPGFTSGLGKASQHPRSLCEDSPRLSPRLRFLDDRNSQRSILLRLI